MTRVTITVTLDQASAIARALECYSRLCIGQLEVVAVLVRDGTIPIGGVASSEPRKHECVEGCDLVERHLRDCKLILGYSSNGSNSIGHAHVDVTGRRAWEIKKVLVKALAEYRNPRPDFPTVDYDGRILRYTNDPDAIVQVEEGSS